MDIEIFSNLLGVSCTSFIPNVINQFLFQLDNYSFVTNYTASIPLEEGCQLYSVFFAVFVGNTRIHRDADIFSLFSKIQFQVERLGSFKFSLFIVGVILE